MVIYDIENCAGYLSDDDSWAIKFVYYSSSVLDIIHCYLYLYVW